MFQHPPKTFLIIQTAFIGDVVLATSLVENLHAAYPDAGIDFLLRKGNEALFEGHPYIRTVYTLDKKKDKFRNIWQHWKGIRQRHYDAVINVHRFAVTGFLAAFSGAGYIAGFDKNPFSRLFHHQARHVFERGIHETTRNHQLLQGLVDDPVYSLGLPPGNLDSGSIWGSYIGLFFLGASFVAIGIFASSLTDNQIVSFILAVFISFFLYMGLS